MVGGKNKEKEGQTLPLQPVPLNSDEWLGRALTLPFCDKKKKVPHNFRFSFSFLSGVVGGLLRG